MTALDKLRDGGTAIGTFAMIDGTLSVEGLARAGFDFICLDRQHGLLDDATVWNQIVAIGKAGKACPWVRIPWNRPEDAMRAASADVTMARPQMAASGRRGRSARPARGSQPLTCSRCPAPTQTAGRSRG